MQQPPISASGFSSQAFAPHFPHTERTQRDEDLLRLPRLRRHDNNAIMAQLLLQGTGFVNFIGLHAYVGAQRHVAAIQVTEWDEPQAVIGSYLQRYAYPDWYAAHQKRGRRLEPSCTHHGTVVRRPVFNCAANTLYVAEGAGGMRVYDVAGIANKGISQRIVSAPASALGQDTHIAVEKRHLRRAADHQPVHPPSNEGERCARRIWSSRFTPSTTTQSSAMRRKGSFSST